MVVIAKAGIDAYKRWRHFTKLASPRAVFQEDGVLWLAPGGDRWTHEEAARLNELGVSAEALDATEVMRRYPALNPCGIAPDLVTGQPHECNRRCVGLFEPGGGYVDPMDAAQDLAEACKAAGVSLRFRAEVTGVRVSSGRFVETELANGDVIPAAVLVNAAGPWCTKVNALAGLEQRWRLAPVRIQVLVMDRPQELRGHLPVTADLTAGIYFRAQNGGQQLIISSLRAEDEREVVDNPDQYAKVPDHEFEYLNLHALHHRLPSLPGHGAIRGYCGLYTMNLDDVHPLVGPTEIDGYWVANGFSGHGLKIAPAIGSMIARELTGTADDHDCEIDLEYLAYDRQPIAMESLSVVA